LSSRNAYLNPAERKSALVLYQSLTWVQELFDGGEHDSARLVAASRQFASEPGVRLDYLEIVDPDTLEPVPSITQRVLVAVAAFVGKTRLIDNILLGG